MWPAALLKKRLRHRCFLVSFAKFLRNPFLRKSSRRLILKGENGIRWNRYDINRTRPRHGYKYTKYNLCSVWWWLCQQATPKQNLKLNSWKSKASWKKALLIKKACKRSHILQRNERFQNYFKRFQKQGVIIFVSWSKNRGVFRTQWSIYDEAFLQKQLTAFTYFHRRPHHRCLTEF